MKKLFFLVALLANAPVWGQALHIRAGSADRAFPIMLSVADSLSGEPVSFASVYLKPVKDTIITNFTLSDAKGKAILDRVVRGEYNLNVEMMGYKPYRKKFYFTEIKNLGKILLQEDAKVLDAAKVTAAVAPIQINGDTVVYNAAAYSIAESDMLKDLLKKMPGIEVDEDGSVKVQGESVNQITVNGRTFFMGDRRAALDNLPAKAVEQIKITDHESDMEKVTGVKRNSATRTRDMDVSLKQEYKKGTFGNVQASAGASLPSKEQDEMLASVPFLWNTSGMLSAFGEKDQVTLIGRGENVDNGSRIMARRSGGLTTGGQAGVNYTTDRINKLDSGVSVYYNGSSKENAQRSSTEEYPLSGDTVQSERTSSSQNTDHRITASVSLRSNSRRSKGFLFSFEPRFTFQDGRSSSLSASSSQLNGSASNSATSESSSHSRSLGSQGSLMLAFGRFAKKGRSISVNGRYNLNGSQGDSRDYSLTQYASTGKQELRDLLYKNNGGSGSGNLSITYGEPLGQNWILQGNVRGEVSRSRQNKNAFNADGSVNDYYTTASVNNSLNGLGSVLLQYSKEETILQAGVSVSSDNLYTYSKSLGQEKELGKGEWIWNWAPELSLNFPGITVRYQGRSSQPSQNRMMSLLDITDPLRISTGNLYLKPGFNHDLSFEISSLRRHIIRGASSDRLLADGRGERNSIHFRITSSMRQNDVVNATWYDAARVRYSIPVNAHKPSWSTEAYLSGYQVLDKQQYWRLMFSGRVLYSTSMSYQPVGTLPGMDSQAFDYNAFMADFWGDASGSRFYAGTSGFRESFTRQLGYNASLDLSYSSARSLRLTLSNELNGSHAWYSLDGKANTNTYVYSCSLDASYTTPHQFKLTGYYGLQRFFGYSDSFSKLTQSLNLSLSKDWRSLTFTLQGRDLLNAGLSVSHSVSATGTTDSYRLSMGRHFLAGVVWRFGRMGSTQMSRAQRASSSVMSDFGR